jgi:hypothetical protein
MPGKEVRSMAPIYTVREDPRLYDLLIRYPGIIGTPPSLERVFVIPPRPGPDPAPMIAR